MANRIPAGFAFGGANYYTNVPVGSVGNASLGNDSTPVAGTTYYTSLFIPRYFTAPSLYFMNGNAVSGKFIISLYNVKGTLITNSSLSGTNQSGVNSFMQGVLLATAIMNAPGIFYVGLQFDGTVARFRTVASSTYVDILSKSTAGSFGTIPAFTPPTTFVTATAPIVAVGL